MRSKISYIHKESAAPVELFQVLGVWVSNSDQTPLSWSNSFWEYLKAKEGNHSHTGQENQVEIILLGKKEIELLVDGALC